MPKLLLLLFLLVLAGGAGASELPPIQTVFLIVMENTDWGRIKDSPSAPYINNVLLPQASYCTRFFNSDVPHPSEPNYIWLEAGTNCGIIDNQLPAQNHVNTTNHLVSLLRDAGISWKTYQEDIPGTEVPLYPTNLYVPRHNPFVYFDDITGTNNPADPYGIAHIRPYSELAQDLTNNTVARYNFITPNLCDDMHTSCNPLYDNLRQGDNWLAAEIPRILNSAAYTNGGAIFITWDESDLYHDAPIGLIVLSPLAKGGGYFNSVVSSHSSTLRTLQEIFQVTPFLGDAAQANDLSDLFTGYTLWDFQRDTNGVVSFGVSGASPGKTNVVQASNDLQTWTTIGTEVPTTGILHFTDATPTSGQRFYRALQLP